MDLNENQIRELALLRVAKVFNIGVEKLGLESRFGTDLVASFVSDFRDNELDKIDQDIHDVADKETLEEFGSGKLTITTVGDYCNHMVKCYRKKAKDVTAILSL